MSRSYLERRSPAPESYEARIRDAWLEHSNNFRPKWVELQKEIRAICKDLDPSKKAKTKKALETIASSTNDYLVLSLASFNTYLHKLTFAYIFDQMVKNGKEDQAKELTDLVFLKIGSLQSPKRKGKKKTASKKKAKRKAPRRTTKKTTRKPRGKKQ